MVPDDTKLLFTLTIPFPMIFPLKLPPLRFKTPPVSAIELSRFPPLFKLTDPPVATERLVYCDTVLLTNNAPPLFTESV